MCTALCSENLYGNNYSEGRGGYWKIIFHGDRLREREVNGNGSGTRPMEVFKLRVKLPQC
jgi:hypothetical protein